MKECEIIVDTKWMNKKFNPVRLGKMKDNIITGTKWMSEATKKENMEYNLGRIKELLLPDALMEIREKIRKYDMAQIDARARQIDKEFMADLK